MLRSLVGTKADVRLKMMAAEDDFIISPPRKTVRFGGTVTEVLEKYKQGDINDYELLKHQLLDPEIKDAQIINWLHEFRSSVMYLTKDFEQLVVIVLKMPWLRRSKEVVEEYLSFLGNLVSAQTIFLRPCLSMIVSFFIPPRVIIKEGDVDISDSEDEDENLPGNFDTCHRALQIVARYVPSAPRFLMPILAEKFPFVTKSARTLECYVHNLLRITVYFPALRADVLQLVTEKLLKMDVSASRQDIEEAEEAALQALETGDGTTAEEGLFNMDEDEDAEAQEKSMGSLANEMMAHPIAERLDLVLSILFSYIKDVCYINGEMDLSRTKDLYRDLLAVFDKLILPTHASCAVQYSMFYVCSFKLGLAEAFLEHLWKKLQNPNNPAVIRQAACNYIGSFLARATFLPIVKYQLVFCYTIIERNNRQLIPTIRSSTGGDSVQTCINPLDSFFPFDPCVLKRSKKVIDPVYQVWEDSTAESMQEFQKPPEKAVADEDDFLKGETPQTDSLVGSAPGSYDSHLLSPASSVGSPPVRFLQQQL
ncbi:RNA polymerase I-specific transcription initiation factor RRN3 isoform X2 [Rhinatrema bivittatum]|uniref:RNA polymerase I-specific transcription initiation factor RRN3 isoform X2 n=1 Tax=Rhinatrema bivittatum TaxID=194408 RepID=UPI00112802C6|nr:RNA polymerase I-specific transcription initiation factor RRN3 isoform X2 [Rhinatrema bivittatum]